MVRVSNPRIPNPRRFPNPEIPELSRCQSRDLGIIKFYVLNLFYTSFQLILHIYPFIESTSRVISSRCVTASLIYLLTFASADSLSQTDSVAYDLTVRPKIGRARGQI